MQLRRVTFTDEVPRRPDFRLVVGAGGDAVSGVMLTGEDYASLMDTLRTMESMQARLRDRLTAANR